MSDAYADIRGLPLIAVLSSLGFTDWKSRKNDTEWFGKCPVHDAKKNNTSFSFDAEGKFNCFSCQAKGKGAIDIFMAVRKVGFQAAVDALKGFNIQTELAKQARKPEIRQLQVPVTENPPFKSQYQKYYVPSDWLAKRGFTPETLAKFEVGQYDNPKRQSAYKGKILLPVRRWKDGELVAYLARDHRPAEERGEDPKYIFPKGFAKHLELFGSNQLKEKAPLRVLYLVESPLCVMKFHQLGFPAVSCFGWSISPEQASILSNLTRGVVYLPDKNKQNEASAFAGLLCQRMWVKMPELPDGVDDPENLTADQIRALTGA